MARSRKLEVYVNGRKVTSGKACDITKFLGISYEKLKRYVDDKPMILEGREVEVKSNGFCNGNELKAGAEFCKAWDKLCAELRDSGKDLGAIKLVVKKGVFNVD